MSILKFVVVFSVIFVSVFPFFVFEGLASSGEDVAASAISQAEDVVVSAYEAVLEAEQSGADVSSLLVRLNDAGEHLAKAHMLYELEVFDGAVHSANLSSEIGEEVKGEAYQLKNEAYGLRVTDLLVRVIGSTLGVAAVIFASFFGWHAFKRRYSQRNSKNKTKQLQGNLSGYRTTFTVVSLVFVLIACTPALSLISIPIGGEDFSGLWLLGPEHRAENYPFNVGVNETQGPIYVGVSNHMGCSRYYMVYVKLRNQTQPLPDSSNSTPSPLNSTYEFQFFLADGRTWETPLIFSFQGQPMFVSDISINGVVFPVDCSSTWESEKKGFFCQLFFELWIYEVRSRDYEFYDFVWIWLNMTGS